jgi:hypothetical protein
VVTVEQVADKGYSLAISQYVRPAAQATGQGFEVEPAETSVVRWRTAAEASEVAINDVLALLRPEVSA